MPHSNVVKNVAGNVTENVDAAPFLVANLDAFAALEIATGVLDLAAGSGRNGLWLARHNIPVTLADNNSSALKHAAALANTERLEVKTWLVDLEQETDPLAGTCWDGILVFNYLHRPLLQAIGAAIRPGGLLMYETFTVRQKQYGRPGNPDYLLQEGELREAFGDWQVLHYTEQDDADAGRATAQLLARKPG